MVGDYQHGQDGGVVEAAEGRIDQAESRGGEALGSGKRGP